MNNLNQKTRKLLAVLGIIIILAMPSIACGGTTICETDKDGNSYACQNFAGDAMGIADRIERAANK